MDADNCCHICKSKCEQTLCKNCYVPLFTPIEKHESFAFLEDAPEEIDSKSLKESIVLDFFKSSLVIAEISDFSNLRQLRLSHCQKLTKINLNNMPNLISLDAFDCPCLVEASFSNTPNLIALDLSFCKILAEIKGEFPKIEYFSISHTKIKKLPHIPSVKFIDMSATLITDIKPLCDCSNLQRLILLENSAIQKIEIGKLAKFPSFRSFIGKCKNLDFTECPSKHNIRNIYNAGKLTNAENVNFEETNIYCFTSLKQDYLSFDTPICSGDWYESYRYLYGPYPTPPNDSKPTLSEQELALIDNIYPLPPNVDPKRAAYHIMGAIFGTAIGDCLGIYGEGHDPNTINIFIDQPPEITWTHPITTLRGSYFHRGSFTDDTALMLMFIRSVVSTAVENKTKSESNFNKDDISLIFDPNDSGRRIHHWICHGIDEHLDGIGIGRGGYTDYVVKSKGFDKDTLKVSKKCWIETGMEKSGNGGVMRTGGCGCFLFWDEKKVIEISKQFCKCTHYNPRCAFSSVLISLIISRLIQWRCGLIASFDLDKTIDEVKEIFLRKKGEDEEGTETISDFSEIDRFLYAQNIDDLGLIDDHNIVPPTLSTMGCAIYVLRKDLTYEKGIEEIIRAGGDTDTNAACTGAVLGAKWGFGAIPLHLLDYMWYGGILYRDTVPFLKMMGMKFDPPSYEEIKQFKY